MAHVRMHVRINRRRTPLPNPVEWNSSTTATNNDKTFAKVAGNWNIPLGTFGSQWLKLGRRVELDLNYGMGIIRYIGYLDNSTNKELMLGIQLDNANGDNDGILSGKRYFTCKMYFGHFCPVDHVIVFHDSYSSGLRAAVHKLGTLCSKPLVSYKPSEHKKDAVHLRRVHQAKFRAAATKRLLEALQLGTGEVSPSGIEPTISNASPSNDDTRRRENYCRDPSQLLVAANEIVYSSAEDNDSKNTNGNVMVPTSSTPGTEGDDTGCNSTLRTVGIQSSECIKPIVTSVSNRHQTCTSPTHCSVNDEETAEPTKLGLGCPVHRNTSGFVSGKVSPSAKGSIAKVTGTAASTQKTGSSGGILVQRVTPRQTIAGVSLKEKSNGNSACTSAAVFFKDSAEHDSKKFDTQSQKPHSKATHLQDAYRKRTDKHQLSNRRRRDPRGVKLSSELDPFTSERRNGMDLWQRSYKQVPQKDMQSSKSQGTILASGLFIGFAVGDRVQFGVAEPLQTGVVRWVQSEQAAGFSTHYSVRTRLLGVQLDDATGESDGVYRGKRCFQTNPFFATFCGSDVIIKYKKHNWTCFRRSPFRAYRIECQQSVQLEALPPTFAQRTAPYREKAKGTLHRALELGNDELNTAE